MKEIRRDGEQVELSLSLDELRLIGATMNEAVNGGYAIPEDALEALTGQSGDRVEALLDSLMALVRQ